MAGLWPMEPMIARFAAEIPVGERWVYEPKFDGFRCLAYRPAVGRAQLRSRRQRSFTTAFPEAAAVVGELPLGTVVDGELVALVEGRVDFEALQRRLVSQREPAPVTLVAFDLLAHQGHDLRTRPLWARRELLALLIGDGREGLALMPMTTAVVGAEAWMQHQDRGVEGVVAKRADHGYLPHRRWWSKVRTRETSEAIVGGISGDLDRPRGLILGRYDEHDQLRVIGRTVPLAGEVSAELSKWLRPSAAEHPWPAILPGGRFGLAGSDPVEYTPVAPELVVEIETDAVFEKGRYRHLVRFVRARLDLRPDEVRL